MNRLIGKCEQNSVAIVGPINKLVLTRESACEMSSSRLNK